MAELIKEFSSKTITEMQYYVYVYSDPDTGMPFYVGKGKGNRVFAHLEDASETEKCTKIANIKANGKMPLIEILVHGIDEKTALKVEAAAIDLIGIENLTNRQRGYQTGVFGKIEVGALEARYSCEEIKREDIVHNVVAIKINRRYRNDMTPHELYEATRRYWKVNMETVNKTEYAFAVYDGMVVEVYKIAQWFNAFSTMGDSDNKTDEDNDNLIKRYEFVGNVAPKEVRGMYKYKSISGLFSKGAQNPIKYFLE